MDAPPVPRSHQALRFAGVAGVVALLLAVAATKIWSADFWWQMRNGQWMLENGRVLTQEMYSHTAAGNPLREMRWVYCIWIHLAYTHAGPWLLQLWLGLMVGGTWLALLWRERAQALTALVLAAVTLGLLAGSARWVMRPELISYLMAALFLVTLDRSMREPKWRGVWLLPLLQVLWVNGHTTFLFGPVLSICALAADTVTRLYAYVENRRIGSDIQPPPAPVVNLPLLAAALLTIPACWINPYGHWGAMYAVQMYEETRGSHATARLIKEMASPLVIPLSQWTIDLWAGVALIAFAAVTGIPLLRRFSLWRWGVLLIGGYLFFMLQRNTALSAVICGFVAVRNAADLARMDHPWAMRPREGLPGAAASACVGLAALGLAWGFLSDRINPLLGIPRESGVGVVEWYQPRGVERFLLDQPVKGNLFNVMRDGSYLVWRVSAKLPVYVDGRTDAYGPALLEESAGVGARNWAAFVEQRSINAAVVPSSGDAALARALLASDLWALVTVDPASMLFLRRIPEHAAIIEAHATDLALPLASPVAPFPQDELPAWKRAIGGVSAQGFAVGYAQAYLSLNAPRRAMPYLDLAVKGSPNLRLARVRLASIKLAEADPSGAQPLLQGLPPALVAEAYRDAAGYIMAAGDVKRALPALQSALQAAPGDTPLRTAYADALFQTGEFSQARAQYQIVTREAPAANEFNKLGAVCEQLGDTAAAVAAFEASLKLNQNQAEVWNMLGGNLGRAGDLRRAEAAFANALTLRPDYAPARRNLDRVRAMLQQAPK